MFTFAVVNARRDRVPSALRGRGVCNTTDWSTPFDSFLVPWSRRRPTHNTQSNEGVLHCSSVKHSAVKAAVTGGTYSHSGISGTGDKSVQRCTLQCIPLAGPSHQEHHALRQSARLAVYCFLPGHSVTPLASPAHTLNCRAAPAAALDRSVA